MLRRIFLTYAHLLAVMVLLAAAPARAEPSGPWISAFLIYLAPTTAQMAGAGFQPGESLWLDVTDPLGVVTSITLYADAEGRVLVDIVVLEPGVYWGRIRDGAGQLLSEADLLVGYAAR